MKNYRPLRKAGSRRGGFLRENTPNCYPQTLIYKKYMESTGYIYMFIYIYINAYMHLITMEKDVMNLKINGEKYMGRSGRRKRKGIL